MPTSPENLPSLGLAMPEVRREVIPETLLAGIPWEVRFCELVDNAIEFSLHPSSRPRQVTITLDLEDDCLRIANSPARPMTHQEALQLNTFFRAEPDKTRGSFSQEHGVGGTTTLLSLADRDTGSLHMATPYKGGGYIIYHNPQWHQNINNPIEIFHDPDMERSVPQTEIILSGLDSNEIKSLNIHSITQFLYLTYGPLLKSGFLGLTVLYRPKGRRSAEQITTAPINPYEFPFASYQDHQIEIIPKSTDHPALEISLRLGLLDLPEAHAFNQNLEKSAPNPLSTHPKARIQASSLMVYHQGRLLGIFDLEDLEIPRFTRKHSLDPLCGIVDMPQDSRIKKTAFKQDLDHNDPVSKQIYTAIRTHLAQLVAQILDSEPKVTLYLSEAQRLHLDNLRTSLVPKVNQLFESIEAFAQEFNLSTLVLTESDAAPQGSNTPPLPRVTKRGKRRRSQPTGKIPTLPGMHLAPTPDSPETPDSLANTPSDQTSTELHELHRDHPLPPITAQLLEPASTPTHLTQLYTEDGFVVDAVVLNTNSHLIQAALKNLRSSASQAIIIEHYIRAIAASSGRDIPPEQIDDLIHKLLS